MLLSEPSEVIDYIALNHISRLQECQSRIEHIRTAARSMRLRKGAVLFAATAGRVNEQDRQAAVCELRGQASEQEDLAEARGRAVWQSAVESRLYSQ